MSTTERYIAAADLGSSKVALAVAKVRGDDIQVIYYKEEPSDGIRYGCVVHPRRAAVPLRRLILDAETELSIRIRRLVTGLPRYEVLQESASAQMERSDAESLITPEEVNALKESAVSTYPVPDPARQVIYGAVAQSFSADEDFVGVSEKDITGVTAEVIEGHFKLFIGARKPVANLDLLFGELGVTLARKVFSPDAAACAVLSDTEKTNGVALIEIGAGVSSVAIYRGRVLRHYASIPFAGGSVTGDIAIECGLDERLSENIKKAWGACMPSKVQSLSEKILQINDDETGSFEHISVNYLSQVITCRVREILDAVLYLIRESGYADKLRSGLVLTGHGSNLINLAVLLREMSGCRVRVGGPRRQAFSAFGYPDIYGTGAGAAAGMILEAAGDGRLCCADDLEAPDPSPVPGVPPAEGREESPGEPETPGVLFPQEPSAGGVIVPGEDGRRGRRQNKIVKWITRHTREAERIARKAFDDSVGDLFDSMTEQEDR